jgi:hypothetical protein
MTGRITQQKKSAVKMHTLLDDDSLLPEFENNTLCDTLRIKNI